MSRGKKKEKINRHKIVFLLIMAIILVLILVVIYRILNGGDYYKIESRIKQVKKTRITEETDFESIGWLRIQGTDIDLPLLYSSDRQTNFPVQLEEYVWTKNTDKKFHNMIRILGHNIFNLSAHPKMKSDDFHRFEELMNFVYYDFAKDNKYIQLTIDGKDYLYKIFSAGFIDKFREKLMPTVNDYTKKQIKNQIDTLNEYSLYNYDIEVDENDKIIYLSTCTRFFGVSRDYSFYVAGRLVRDDEKIDNYDVTKKDDYKDIEKILEGDVEDEEDDDSEEESA